MRKYNLFELVGIYIVGKEFVKIGKVFANVFTEGVKMAKTRYYNEEMSKANKEISKAIETITSINMESEKRDELVLAMYRNGHSRSEILEYFGEDYISKDRVERICDEEDRSWGAEA